AATRSLVSGAAFAIRNAQARPAMMAKWTGRVSGCLKLVVANILFLPDDCIIRHCERSEAIQLSCRGDKAGLLRRFAPRNDGWKASLTLPDRTPCAARRSLAAAASSCGRR